MTLSDITLLALAAVALLLIGGMIGIYLAAPRPPEPEPEPPPPAKQEPKLLGWMSDGLREMTLHRLRTSGGMKMRNFVTPHLLSDGQWRTAKEELLQAGVLHIPKGTTALLTERGTAWVEKELFNTNKQTPQTAFSGGVGQGRGVKPSFQERLAAQGAGKQIPPMPEVKPAPPAKLDEGWKRINWDHADPSDKWEDRY